MTGLLRSWEISKKCELLVASNSMKIVQKKDFAIAVFVQMFHDCLFDYNFEISL